MIWVGTLSPAYLQGRACGTPCILFVYYSTDALHIM
jgi:hypothetical protein